MNSGDPDLSVILITPERYSAIEKVVGCLRAQQLCDRIELVIVAPSRDRLELPATVSDGFRTCQIVEVGAMEAAGEMMAAGFRAAKAPVVVYVEEHSYPATGWAEALIVAHRGPWAAVGPAVCNANPETGESWAALFLEFGAWVPPATAGEARLLAAHQTSYKKAMLLRYGPELGSLLESEAALHARLRSDGHRLYFEPAAQTDHVNVSRLPSLIRATFLGYRMFAADRAAHARWPFSRRALYVASTPLLPPLRLYRVVRELHRSGKLFDVGPRMFMPLLLASFSASAGELAGYSCGAGVTARKRLGYELERLRYVAESDQRKLRG